MRTPRLAAVLVVLALVPWCLSAADASTTEPAATPAPAGRTVHAAKPTKPGKARMDLRVLVLDDGDSGVAAIKARLVEEGVPMTVVDLWAADRPTLTNTYLVGRDRDGAYGRFAGVVMPNEAPGQLSEAEATALAAYERGFGVREIAAYTWAHPEVGLNYAEDPGFMGVVDGMEATVTPAAKKHGWSYLKGSVTLDDGDPDVDESYGYVAPPLAEFPAGQSFTPFLTTTIPDTDVEGVLMGQFSDNGRETLVFTFSNNQWVTQFKVLGHGVIQWLTRGMSTSYYRNWFSIHSDDLFLGDARWSIEGHCTIGDGCDPMTYPDTVDQQIRMTPADVEHLVAWQEQSGIKIDQAFNGFGSQSWAQDTGQPDTLLPAFKQHAQDIRFINHTWEQPNLGSIQDDTYTPWQCGKWGDTTLWVDQKTIETAIRKNIDFARTHGLPLDPTELVTGEHSGLRAAPEMPTDNPYLSRAYRATGIEWTASDASRETDVRAVGSALTVPRHPMNIFYNVGTKAEEVAEYNWIYTSREDGGSGYCTDHPDTETCIEPLDPVTGFDDYLVPVETRIAMQHVVANDPMPHYAHQSNLAEDRILYPVLDSILAQYRATFSANAPVVNDAMAATGLAMKRQRDWASAMKRGAVTARVEGDKIRIRNLGRTAIDVPVTAPTGARLKGRTFGEAYAGSRSGWVTVQAGGSATIDLARDAAFTVPKQATGGTYRDGVPAPAPAEDSDPALPPTPTGSTYSGWVPEQGTDWQIQYAGDIDLGFDVPVYDLDWEDTTKAQVDQLRADGKHGICYFSAGSFEDWRPDAAAFTAEVKGKPMAEWEGETWLDTRQLDVLLPIMEARMDVCAAKGFEAVDPDNVDGYQNDTGFPLTGADSAAYLSALADMAHEKGLAMGLKNGMGLIPRVGQKMDFAVNESCEEWSECGTYSPMVQAGKAILHIEYAAGEIADVCANRPEEFSTLRKNWDLDAPILGTC